MLADYILVSRFYQYWLAYRINHRRVSHFYLSDQIHIYKGLNFMSQRSAFIYDEILAKHVLSDSHPMKPVRIRYTHDLLSSYAAFDGPDSLLAKPRLATKEELLYFHTPEYVAAVKQYGSGQISENPDIYNLGPGDNPVYEGMYAAAAMSTGASLSAVEMLMSGEVDIAMSVSGGLHHAMPGYAYGFCVFNDPVIAIKTLVAQGMKVAYVDIDCHHGDGVQHAFYDTDSVLTISLHESGAFLFPGTGYVQEIGAGRGRGYSINVPLYPYTTDDVYLWAFNEIVPPLLEAFNADVLVTQLGIDSHFRDPITHLALTVQGIEQIIRGFNKPNLKHSKWLALGGGGYDLQAVARAWTLAYGVMTDQRFSNDIPSEYSKAHNIVTLADVEVPKFEESLKKQTMDFAQTSVKAIHNLVFPQLGLRLT